MHFRHFLGFIATLCLVVSLPFSALAQTAPQATTVATTTPSFDVEKYTKESLEKAMTSWASQEAAFINPQKIKEKSIQDNLVVEVSPSSPKAGQKVTVTITSYLSDLNKAKISWYLNGKLVLSGTGKRTYSFTNGNAGQTTQLSFTANTNDGFSISRDLSWTPVGVTLLWEADTYTPPFYKGKPLMTSESRVRAVAIPDVLKPGSTSLTPNNLVFVWEKDGESVAGSSGFGKDSFLFLAPRPYRDLDVRLKVSSLNDSMKSEIRLTPSLSKPFILFYENHPLLGMWYNRPFGTTLNLNKKELSLSAEPFFFSNETSSELPSNSYSWQLNGSDIDNSTHLVTLRNEEGTAGTSNIYLGIRGVDRTSQAAEQTMRINFQEDASRTIAF